MGSMVELQGAQSGGRLAFSSTAGRFKSTQLSGPVLPQQLNCSVEQYNYVLAEVTQMCSAHASTYCRLHKGNNVVDILIKVWNICIDPKPFYDIITQTNRFSHHYL